MKSLTRIDTALTKVQGDDPIQGYAHTGETAYFGFFANQVLFIRTCVPSPGAPRCDKGSTVLGECPNCHGLGREIRAINFDMSGEVKV